MMVMETLLMNMLRDMKIILWHKKNLKTKIKTKTKKRVWHSKQMMIKKKAEKRNKHQKKMIQRRVLELKKVMLISLLTGGMTMTKRKKRKLKMIPPMLLKILKFIKK